MSYINGRLPRALPRPPRGGSFAHHVGRECKKAEKQAILAKKQQQQNQQQQQQLQQR